MTPTAKKRLVKWLIVASASVLVLGGAAAGCFVVRAQSAFHECAPADEALYQVRNHPEAVAVLGEPVEAGYWIQGSLTTSFSGSTGSADLWIPLEGPKAKGKAHVVASVKPRGMMAKQWVFEPISLAVEGGPTLTLSVPPRCSTGTCSAGAYVQALRKVRGDARVLARLGTPIEEEPSHLSGGMSASDDEGEADFDVRITGPKGAAQMIGDGTLSEAFQRLHALKVLLLVKNPYGRWERDEDGTETIVLVEAKK